jgi:hypothetical protein
MGSGGRKNQGGTPTGDAPVLPTMTAVDYGPLVAQSMKKRFGRQQTILAGAGPVSASATGGVSGFKTILGKPTTGTGTGAAPAAPTAAAVNDAAAIGGRVRPSIILSRRSRRRREERE